MQLSLIFNYSNQAGLQSGDRRHHQRLSCSGWWVLRAQVNSPLQRLPLAVLSSAYGRRHRHRASQAAQRADDWISPSAMLASMRSATRDHRLAFVLTLAAEIAPVISLWLSRLVCSKRYGAIRGAIMREAGGRWVPFIAQLAIKCWFFFVADSG